MLNARRNSNATDNMKLTRLWIEENLDMQYCLHNAVPVLRKMTDNITHGCILPDPLMSHLYVSRTYDCLGGYAVAQQVGFQLTNSAHAHVLKRLSRQELEHLTY